MTLAEYGRVLERIREAETIIELDRLRADLEVELAGDRMWAHVADTLNNVRDWIKRIEPRTS